METSKDKSNVERSLQEFYDKLFKESLKLHKVNKANLKKLHRAQHEKDNLAAKFEE